jgi:dienelactone hydrolase
VLFLYQKNTLKISTFFFATLLAGCAAVGSVVVPLESIAKPSGKYGIGTQIHFWTDSSRSEEYTTSPTDFRELLVQVWYPAEIRPNHQRTTHLIYPKKSVNSVSKNAGVPAGLVKHSSRLMSNAVQGAQPIKNKKFPLILFSHGDGGSTVQNLSQIEELVSNGYIVAACDHTYNASITFDRGGNSIFYKRNVTWDQQANYHRKHYTNKLIQYRYEDIAFVLGELSKQELQEKIPNHYFSMINFDKIGMMGHSMGGGTSYYALLNDNRIKAALALDGWFFSFSEETTKHNTNKPFMHIGQEQFMDPKVVGDMHNTEDGLENFRLYTFILEHNKPSYAVYIKNSLHYTFTDLKQVYMQDKALSFPLTSLGTVDKAVVRNTINLSMMNFFDATLKDKEFEKILYKNYENEVIFTYNEN